MMEGKSLTPKKELAQRSPTDDEATYVANDDVCPGTRLPERSGSTDEYSLDVGKNGGFIAVIESSVFLRECIRRSLQSAFPLPVITYPSVSELQRQPRPVGPTLVALSLLEVGKEASFHTLKMLPESFPGIPVIVLSHKNDPELARTAIRYGAKGYIPFTMEFAIAVEAVRFVLAGGTYAPMDCLDYPRVAAAPPSAPGSTVTNRELAVVRAIQQGKSNKVIAYDMNMCESTVKVHVRNIMKKLKAKNRTDVAMRLGAELISSGTQGAVEQSFLSQPGDVQAH
jgi:DNA-binding NarL/FixJ family response regulator